ncbi:MAG TPA: metallopeptidase TldD-related protein, partial [Kofleriaceae bacterium]|nr:metallopeptidase TldD-related protein [Kofleriaceae bacterium]
GLASAYALAFGCGPPPKPARRAPDEFSGEVRAWLRDAVALIHGAGMTGHALAVSRSHTVAAIDVLGAGVNHARADGVVLVARDAHGRREQITSDLTRTGVETAARALAGKVAPARIEFGPPARPAPVPKPDPAQLADSALLDSIAAIAKRDGGLSSRIVYASGMLEADDAMVWSIAEHRDLEQRLYRVRRQITRVAWNGTRPMISEVSRAWSGGIHDQTFGDDELAYARDTALALMTPGAFADGDHDLVLAPDVVAGIVDAATRALWTTRAARRPEIAARFAPDKLIASAAVTIVDDPTVANAYGGYHFDDTGELAGPMPLVDRGKLVGRIERGLRPGHTGVLEPMPSHVRFAPGGSETELVLDAGYLLEGHRDVLVDPASDRVVVSVQRALEVQHGQRTGRAYADIELVGDLTTLLGTIADVTKATRVTGIRDERDGLPRWRSIEAPWLRARGLVRARRSQA